MKKMTVIKPEDITLFSMFEAVANLAYYNCTNTFIWLVNQSYTLRGYQRNNLYLVGVVHARWLV